MKKLSLCAILCSVGLLSACQVTTRSPEVEIETPGGVEIKVKDGEKSSGDGKFCPPGQAKKGNC